MQQAAAKVKALIEKLLPQTVLSPSGAGEAGAEDAGQEDEPDVLAADPETGGPGGAGLLPGQGGQGPELPGHLGLGGYWITCLHLTKM